MPDEISCPSETHVSRACVLVVFSCMYANRCVCVDLLLFTGSIGPKGMRRLVSQQVSTDRSSHQGSHSCASVHLCILGPPLDGLNPFTYTLKLTNMELIQTSLHSWSGGEGEEMLDRYFNLSFKKKKEKHQVIYKKLKHLKTKGCHQKHVVKMCVSSGLLMFRNIKCF